MNGKGHLLKEEKGNEPFGMIKWKGEGGKKERNRESQFQMKQ
jgi:hypothetical protein